MHPHSICLIYRAIATARTVLLQNYARWRRLVTHEASPVRDDCPSTRTHKTADFVRLIISGKCFASEALTAHIHQVRPLSVDLTQIVAFICRMTRTKQNQTVMKRRKHNRNNKKEHKHNRSKYSRRSLYSPRASAVTCFG